MSSDINKIAYMAAKDMKASRVLLFEVKGKSDLCDFQLICSAASDRQARAISEAIESEARKLDILPAAVEGRQTGQWILMDYGSLLVHVFQNDIRDYYNLETLWQGSPVEIA